jgi:hypothetical protein
MWEIVMCASDFLADLPSVSCLINSKKGGGGECSRMGLSRAAIIVRAPSNRGTRASLLFLTRLRICATNELCLMRSWWNAGRKYMRIIECEQETGHSRYCKPTARRDATCLIEARFMGEGLIVLSIIWLNNSVGASCDENS